jgi:hypothetical protein
VVSALTKLVSHGSAHFQPASCSTHRTERARVSSMPNIRVGSGSGSHLAAAATSARWAVGHVIPYRPVTSDTARFPDPIAVATASRSRLVNLARSGISDTWMNDRTRHDPS